uniref:Endonuclease/exonuclease/phosphatase domain-containing protein n=1 Tax=Aegilops tauschii subsp. strangulata TaxID=200361 RepID=A0A453Q5L8_AEGTS
EFSSMELPGGDRRTVREVLALCKANSPGLVFLSETRQASSKMEKIKWRLQMKGFAGVSSDGLSGGLALYWDENLQVTGLDSCARYIDVRIVDGANDKTWRTTYVYGEARVENRHRMWSALSNLRATSSEPWLVCGDFNEAMWQHEHLSLTQRSENQMQQFRDCLLACELMDLGFSGIPYTYDNGQVGNRNFRVRLDRACADE